MLAALTWLNVFLARHAGGVSRTSRSCFLGGGVRNFLGRVRFEVLVTLFGCGNVCSGDVLGASIVPRLDTLLWRSGR